MPVKTPINTDSRQIARAAGTVMLALAISMLIGLLRRALVANAFGTNLEIEAFAAANRVSETLFTLVAGGALASAFIPTYTTLLTKDDQRGAWRLASAVGNLIVIILSILGLVAAVFAPQIVRYLLAPGFSNDPYKEALTVNLLRIMLPSAIIFSLSGLVMGILNSHQKFLIPALAPSMYSLGMIVGLIFLVPQLGIYGLAWGVLLGASLHLILQIPSLIRLGGKYYATLGLKYPPVYEVARLMGPRLLGVAVVQLNFWINVWLASFMVEGSVNGLIYAFALMLMPQTIIAQSIAIAAMPTFSAQVAKGRLDDMRSSLADSLRGVLLLSIPAMIGIILLRKELVIFVYQRGEFTDFSTQLVSWALLWYSVGLVGHSVVEIMSRAFYAMHDTKTPVFVGIGAMSLNVIFSLIFSAMFSRLGWMPLGGLALANSLATGLEMVMLLILMRRRLNGLQGRALLLTCVKACVGTGVMWSALWVWLQLSSSLPAWSVVIGGILIGGVVYVLMIYALGVSEVRKLKDLVLQRFRN
jgi:putative peptidoglycan lipid II flippase